MVSIEVRNCAVLRMLPILLPEIIGTAPLTRFRPVFYYLSYVICASYRKLIYLLNQFCSNVEYIIHQGVWSEL